MNVSLPVDWLRALKKQLEDGDDWGAIEVVENWINMSDPDIDTSTLDGTHWEERKRAVEETAERIAKAGGPVY